MPLQRAADAQSFDVERPSITEVRFFLLLFCDSLVDFFFSCAPKD